MRLAAGLIGLLAILLPVAAAAQPLPWPAGARGPASPAPGPLRVIGSENAGGCIAGALRLPDQGTGFETIHRDRSRFWGAPETIAGIERLGEQVHAAGLGRIVIDDISDARGGPMPGGHVSHQIGLDADIGLTPFAAPLDRTAQAVVVLPDMVKADGQAVSAEFGPVQRRLLHWAADLPGVDRILVNPAIKRALCAELPAGQRRWLHRIRPWWGHQAHMHVHFRCPPGQGMCVDQPPIPAGDGCDATLAWWARHPHPPPPRPGAHPHEAVLPAACRAVMEAR